VIRPPRISSVVAALAFATLSATAFAQGNEVTRAVAGGGISAKGWSGQVDANEAKNGMTINSAKFAAMGNGYHVTTGRRRRTGSRAARPAATTR